MTRQQAAVTELEATALGALRMGSKRACSRAFDRSHGQKYREFKQSQADAGNVLLQVRVARRLADFTLPWKL